MKKSDLPKSRRRVKKVVYFTCEISYHEHKTRSQADMCIAQAWRGGFEDGMLPRGVADKLKNRNRPPLRRWQIGYLNPWSGFVRLVVIVDGVPKVYTAQIPLSQALRPGKDAIAYLMKKSATDRIFSMASKSGNGAGNIVFDCIE